MTVLKSQLQLENRGDIVPYTGIKVLHLNLKFLLKSNTKKIQYILNFLNMC